jgi:hypothetical protein
MSELEELQLMPGLKLTERSIARLAAPRLNHGATLRLPRRSDAYRRQRRS